MQNKSVLKYSKKLLNISQKQREAVVIGIDKALDIRKQYAESISPIDTWEYISSHYVVETIDTWKQISWSNVNDASDAVIVEFWAWLTTNRHRADNLNQPYPQREVIYRWEWANVYTRTASDTAEQVSLIVIKELWTVK